jgi:hypothetical protein
MAAEIFRPTMNNYIDAMLEGSLINWRGESVIDS